MPKTTRHIHRGQRWLHREKYVPNTATCIECTLPSHKGLPPFITTMRTVDGERVKVYRHEVCPANAPELQKQIKELQAAREESEAIRRSLDFHRPGGRGWRPPKK